MLTSPGGSAVSVETQVRNEQIRLLYEQGAVAFIVNGAVATLLAALIGSHVPRAALVAWSAFFAMTWALRGALHVWHLRNPAALDPQGWLRLFAVGTFLAGASWGMAALWLFPTSTVDRFLVAVAIMGLASGAATSISCVRGIYPLYLVPAFLPVAVRFAFDSGTVPLVIIVLSVLYCVGMSVSATMNHRQITKSLYLRFENAELMLRLEALATHDPLTGLANQRLLMDRLDTALRRSKRSADTVAVVFVDCDGLKLINDTHGHTFGNAFLKHISDALARCVRETDTVARIGGDEFIVILEDVSDAASLEVLVRRLRVHATRTFDIDDVTISPHLSIGVARYPQDGADGETLIRHADEAMYRAKGAGGDRVEFYNV